LSVKFLWLLNYKKVKGKLQEHGKPFVAKNRILFCILPL